MWEKQEQLSCKSAERPLQVFVNPEDFGARARRTLWFC